MQELDGCDLARKKKALNYSAGKQGAKAGYYYSAAAVEEAYCSFEQPTETEKASDYCETEATHDSAQQQQQEEEVSDGAPEQ